MATTVQTRPNHYMTLGLTPAASQEEIKDAYAREIILSRVRAFGGTTQVSVAYEALRDPARRKAYDESIGIRREPAPVHLPRAVSFRSSAHFIGAPPPVEPKADLPPAPPPVTETPPEPRIAPFLAAALRSPEPPPAEPPKPVREPEVPRFLHPRAIAAPPVEADETGFEWKRPAVIVGGLLGTVALVGAWAGVQAGNDVEASQPAVTVPVPSAKAPVVAAKTDVEPAARERSLAFAPPARRQRTAARPAESVEPAPSAAVQPTATGPFEQIAEAGAVEAAPAIDEVPAAEAASASLPLSKAAIAQTIRRIGYPCGQVASTSQILGGMYKVTCTSGDTYRAAPVHGRYRFKRL
jgi:hypothetical protein